MKSMVCSDDHTIRCQGRFSAIPGKVFFLVPWIHAINVSSRRLNACTVKQPCPQVLLSIVTHSTEMLGCSWALFWSETTLFERKSSCCFSNLLKSHSQSAAWTRLNQFWLPLLYTNMQNYPSRLWSLKCHVPFCFMLLMPVDCKNTPVLRLFQTLELTTMQNIENKCYGHGYTTWRQGRCMATRGACALGSLLRANVEHQDTAAALGLRWGPQQWPQTVHEDVHGRGGSSKVSKGFSLEVTCFILETLTLSEGGTLCTWTRTDTTAGLLWPLKAHSFRERFSTAKKVSKLTRNKAAFRQEKWHVLTLLGSWQLSRVGFNIRKYQQTGFPLLNH